MGKAHIDQLSGDSGSSLPIVAILSVAPQSPETETGGKRPLELPSHEQLSQLACDDPRAFEMLRRELVESFIDSAPSRLKSRLRGIQFRVDGVRRLSRSALGSTVGVYQLMWTSFLRLNCAWQEVVRLKEEGMVTHASMVALHQLPNGNARILEFKPRPRRDQI
jgi:hypothetical protein